MLDELTSTCYLSQAAPPVPCFCSYQLNVIFDLLLNSRMTTWNLFVNHDQNFGNYHELYNKLSYVRILIGSHLWSIGGQTYR